MARLNNDAREILCNMVAEKAEAKREKMVATLTQINEEADASYNERIEAARRDIDLMIPTIKSGINHILSKHGLGWRDKRYCNCKCTFEDIFENGDLKIDLSDYFSDEKRNKSASRQIVESRLKELDERVAKAKQEILLRAALGMKYDEVVAIVNSFRF